MEIGFYQEGRSIMVKLFVNDAAEAAVLATRIARGAPVGIKVSYEANAVTVLRRLDSEADADAWARALRAGMTEGHLFNLDFDSTGEIRRQ